MSAALYFLAAASAGISAGGFVSVHFALLPSMRSMPDGPAVMIHQQFDRLVHRYCPRSPSRRRSRRSC